MEFKRARSDENKDIRIEEIMSATIRLYNELDYEKITISKISQEISFVRSNIYKYFSSKEEIFLAICEREFKNLARALNTALCRYKTISNSELAKEWSKLLAENTLVFELFPMLNSIIEKNVKLERLVLFKIEFLKVYSELGHEISRLHPEYSEGDIHFIIHKIYLYAISLFNLTKNNSNQQKALQICREEYGISYNIPKFKDDMCDFITFILQGIDNKHS